MSAKQVWIILLTVLFTGPIGFFGAWWIMHKPPVILASLQEADGVVIRGGYLDLDFTLIRNRLCDARVERWLWQDDESGQRRWVPLPSIANPPTAIGKTVRYRLSLPIPANIPSGRWNYFSRTRDECASLFMLGSETVRDSGDVLITVLDPPQNKPLEVIAPPGPVIILPTDAKR